MRYALMTVVVLAFATAHGEDQKPIASGILDGKKVTFPEKSLNDGAKATIALLESCHDIDAETPTEADLKKAIERDHIRLMFAKPVGITVLGKNFKISELVFTQPSNTGVFWLKVGDKVVRCTKFEFQKEAAFNRWRELGRFLLQLESNEPIPKSLLLR